jgi:hypothetical protein
MWSTVIKELDFTGTVEVSVGTDSPLPLRGVPVDVFRFEIDESGETQFERLNQVTTRTDGTDANAGYFEFKDLPVSVEVQEAVSSTPPYGTVELMHEDSLPNLAFRFSVEAEVLSGGVPQGSQFVDIYDERNIIDNEWVNSHPERVHIDPTGNPHLEVLIPEGNAEATFLVSTPLLPQFNDDDFHFLRVGRATCDEIGELGDTRPDYSDKPGYMISSDMTTANSQPSFFGGHVDAPFGHVLYIGGVFGDNLQNYGDNLYYTISFWEYIGGLGDPFDNNCLINEVQILDPLYNKKYIFPNGNLPHGKWETLHLGPFDGVDEDENQVKVYKRPNPQQDEYWPWEDLMAIWNSAAAPNGLIVLAIKAYKKTGEQDGKPKLKEILFIKPSENNHLPLHIDNRPPVPKFSEISTGYANFPDNSINNFVEPLNPCGEIPVIPNQTDGNECIVVDYSIEDGSGNAHPHVDFYKLGIRYTPKGGLSSTNVNLKPAFMFPFKNKLKYNYLDTPQEPPFPYVQDYSSVLVPNSLDGWPPEPNGDGSDPCNQYAAAIYLSCSVRTVNGWGKLFGSPSVSRFVIIKKEGG